MRGFRLFLALLREPAAVVDAVVAAVQARVVPLEEHLRREARDALRQGLRWLLLGMAAAAMALVAGVYLLIGLWLWCAAQLGPTAGSCLLGILFALASLVPIAIARRAWAERSR